MAEAIRQQGTPPRSVLFVCNLNRVRSPMAAALLARAAKGMVVDSCGLAPADEIDPFAWAAMSEIGLDLGEHVPKAFGDLDPTAFELVISLTPEAHRYAEERFQGSGVALDCWEVDDPTVVEGSRDQRMAAYRAVRDALRRRLNQRFPPE
jgi:protein-tyrosine-phosphatase